MLPFSIRDIVKNRDTPFCIELDIDITRKLLFFTHIEQIIDLFGAQSFDKLLAVTITARRVGV